MKLKIKHYTQTLEKEIEEAKITLEQYEWPDELHKREMTREEKEIYDLAFHAGIEEGLKRAKEAIWKEFKEREKYNSEAEEQMATIRREATWEIKQYN